MLSINEGLHFDSAQAVNDIVQFIRSEVRRLGKRGVVLGLVVVLIRPPARICVYVPWGERVC